MSSRPSRFNGLLFGFFLAPFALHGGVPPVPEVEGIMLPRRRVNLSISVEARLREVSVEEGRAVRKGDALAVLYTEAEELDCSRAAAQLKKADFICQSKLKLKQTSGVSELEVVGAEADREIAKIEVERAKANLRDKTLTAPWDGRILRVLKSAGETVNRAEKVIEMIDYSTIYVDVYLDAKFLGEVARGQSASVSGEAIGAQAKAASVFMVDPVIEPAPLAARAAPRLPSCVSAAAG